LSCAKFASCNTCARAVNWLSAMRKLLWIR
jgi:hypothetical protein